MTREEAINIIKSVRNNTLDYKLDKALEMAIEALKATYPYERVIVKRSDGSEIETIYDASRELLILSYVTSDLARDLGWTWKTIKEHEEVEGALGGIEPVTRMESEV